MRTKLQRELEIKIRTEKGNMNGMQIAADEDEVQISYKNVGVISKNAFW